MPTASVIASKMRGKQIVFGLFRPFQVFLGLLRSFKDNYGRSCLRYFRSLKVLSKISVGLFGTF
jgi:hypothetical protein